MCVLRENTRLTFLYDFNTLKCVGFYFFGTVQKQSPGVFLKNGVPRNFAKFTGKHLCQSLFFNKVVGLIHI